MAKKLNERQRKACELYASGTHTQTSARTGAGYKSNGDRPAASKFFKQKHLAKYLKQLRKQNAVKAGVTAEWIRKELVEVHQQAKEVGDHSGCKAALDTLNRMNGNYEKDNEQQSRVSLTMEF